MPKQIQNANLTTALVNEYDLKGRVELELDQRVVPVVLTQDLTPNPNALGDLGMRRQSAAAVVGELAFTMIVPATGTRLEVLEIGTTADLFRSLTLLRFTDLTAMQLLVTLGSPFESLARPMPTIPAAAISPTLQATMRSGSRVAPAQGRDIWVFDQAAGVLRGQSYRFDPPLVLYGRENSSPAAVVLWHLSGNTVLNCQAMVREFPDG